MEQVVSNLMRLQEDVPQDALDDVLTTLQEMISVSQRQIHHEPQSIGIFTSQRDHLEQEELHPITYLLNNLLFFYIMASQQQILLVYSMFHYQL